MPQTIDTGRLAGALRIALGKLVSAMGPDGHWEGELSSSALATATAVSALAVAGHARHEGLVRSGAAWLAGHQNDDGGWGDTPDSPSNVATTMLALAALTLCGTDRGSPILAKANEYVDAHAGPSTDEKIASIAAAYGKDRTFAAPILLNCALAGLVPWDRVPRLPFEMALFPHGWYRLLRLHVVSYALPALIAVGSALHRRHPTRNPLARLLRSLAEAPALRKLEAIQPEGGGFLEAVPLTSFVAMSLAGAGRGDHPVAARCLAFIARSARPDGSWPIDSNLSVWLTSNAIIALYDANALGEIDADKARQWLVAQQHRTKHPYTHAAPGAWAWTHLPGGVPDADDTARAVLALERTGGHRAASDGVRWLLDIQNRDGGWPTFCRGWGRLPFDRSSPDITAHALAALAVHERSSPDPAARRAVQRGLAHLRKAQRSDGSWVPLWFGSQSAPDKSNPVFGTAAVLRSLGGLAERSTAERGAAYLVAAQNLDGGWGGSRAAASSVEETAVAVSALTNAPDAPETLDAVSRGVGYLLGRIDDDTWRTPSPIGLYFSRLWYSERLYPIIWTVEALAKVIARTRAQERRG